MNKLLLPGILLLFTSCQKLVEKWKTNNPVGTDHCQIKKITFNRTFSGEPSIKTLTVEYNEQGNPAFIPIDYVNQNFSYDYGGECGFGYDSLNRLVLYDKNAFHLITYAYEGNSMLPVRDTILTYFHPRYVEYLTWDDQGRLTKLEGKFLEDYWGDEGYPLEYTINFNYDENGNLAIPGRTYDNKTSILRTNKTWMLAARDWSRNNAYPATQTNMYGLPERFDYGSFLGHEDTNMQIEYICE